MSMPIETLLQNLIDSNNRLAQALEGKSTSPGATTSTESKSEASSTDGQKVAGKKTYIWFKDQNQGTVVERGEVLPTGEHVVAIQKGTWDTQCKKHGLDPETGKKPGATDELDELDDLGGDNIGADDDLGGLDELDELDGLEEEPAITRDAVKEKLVEVMKKKGKETVNKLLTKYKAANMPALKEEHFQACYDDAVKLLSK